MNSDLTALISSRAASSNSGGGWLLMVLILSMVFTAWKLPWASTSPRFWLAGIAIFIHLAIGPFICWLVTWSPTPNPAFLAFLGMIQGFSLALAFFGFLTALANRPRQQSDKTGQL